MKIANEGGHHPHVVGWPEIDVSSMVLKSRGHFFGESIHGDSLSERKGAQKSIQIEGLEWIGAEFESMALEVNAMVFHSSRPKAHLKRCPSKVTGSGGLSQHPYLLFCGLHGKFQQGSIAHSGLGLQHRVQGIQLELDSVDFLLQGILDFHQQKPLQKKILGSMSTFKAYESISAR